MTRNKHPSSAPYRSARFHSTRFLSKRFPAQSSMRAAQVCPNCRPGQFQPDTASRQAIVITPRVKLTETWSDNVNVGRSQNQKSSGLITELAPGIKHRCPTSRLRAYVDYSCSASITPNPGYSRTQNALNAFGRLEAVEDWMFVEFSGVISQQTISAFGTQTPTTVPTTTTTRPRPPPSACRRTLRPPLQRHRLSVALQPVDDPGQRGSRFRCRIIRMGWPNQRAPPSRISNGRSMPRNRPPTTASEEKPMPNVPWNGDLYAGSHRVSSKRRPGIEQPRIPGQESKNTSGYGFDWTPVKEPACPSSRKSASSGMAIASTSITGSRSAA